MSRIQPIIVYSPGYDLHLLGVERLHPFDGRKYSRAYHLALHHLGAALARRTLRPRHPIARAHLLAVHSADYLAAIRSRRTIAQIVELPLLAGLPGFLLDWRLLAPMRLATHGTLLAARQALLTGLAFNLGGGFHHASQEQGEGFCFYADVTIAIAALRQAGKLVLGRDRVLIVDLDAHQGNGHERLALNDPDLFIFDLYNRDIFPRDHAARRRIDYEVTVPMGADDGLYLGRLNAHLPQALARAGQARLAFYIAGTDIYEHDQLGGLRVSAQGIFERDRYVLETLAEASIPTIVVTGGGYSPDSHRHIARTVEFLLSRWPA
jgi:histone deacetylase 11